MSESKDEPQLESEWAFEQRRLRFYARHFASLDGIIYTPGKRDETERAICISGFVVSVRNRWFFITAGHVFDDIEVAKKQGQVIENWALDCSYSAEATDQFDTPFDLEGAEPSPLFHEESGLDYAFVPLRPLTRWNLEANGLTPLSDQAWRRNLPNDFDEYFLLGIPTEFVSYDAQAAIINKTMVIAPMDKLTQLPEGISPKEGLFFARLHDVPVGAVNVPRSIKGMSGGPIFGLRHGENGSRYWVIAIQSWWDENSRIIRAFYLRDLCEWLETQLPELPEI